MRFFTTASVTALLCSNFVSALFDYIAPLACLNAKTAFEQIDTDQLVGMWNNTVCSNGCQPKVSEYQSLRDTYLIPALTTEVEKMGNANLTPYYISLMDSFYEMAENTCGAGDSKSLCQDSSQLRVVAKCVQSNGWSLALSNALNLLPIMLANPCQNVVEYISNPEVFKATLPAYFENYAENC